MDNNIEILFFILFIAFSILSAVLDKKKKQKRNEQNKKAPKPFEKLGTQKGEQKGEKTPEELFKEMFGLPDNQEIVRKEEELKKESYDANYDVNYNVDYNVNYDRDSWDPEKEFGVNNKNAEGVAYNLPSREESKSKYSSYSGVGKQFETRTLSDEISKLQDDYNDIQRNINKTFHLDLRKKLKEPTSLRDYIVISEILQKPISLR